MSDCGTCKVCCRVLGVEEIRKTPGEACEFLCDRGCGIYDTRPESCRAFECAWLQMQRSPRPLPKKMRPDKCGVMFVITAQPGRIAAHCDREHALDEAPVREHVERWLRNGVTIIRVVGDKRTLISLKLQ